MKNRIVRINQILGLIFLTGLIGCSYELYQLKKIDKVNGQLLSGQVLDTETYPFHQKYSDAYQQAKSRNYKHAIQGFGQLLEPPKKDQENQFEIDQKLKSQIHFNIANNLFRSGLQRLVTEEGELQEQSKFDYLQAKSSYEQALKLDSHSKASKFNLSLLLSIIPKNIKTVAQDPSGMEISNLPQGLP